MYVHKKSLMISALLLGSVLPAHATVIAADCSKKPLMGALAKLDKTVANTVNLSGTCTEDVVLSGFKDLTIVGVGGATLNSAGPAGSGTTLLIDQKSQVVLQSLAINDGAVQAVGCTGRSSCVLRNVTITGGGSGIGVQDESSADILGTSVIQNSLGTGIGVYGSSTVNIRPEPIVTGGEAGPVISGHAAIQCDNSVTPPQCFPVGIGAVVQDGSFLRADNATFSGNGSGILVQRTAMIKVYSNNPGGGVNNNVNDGIVVRWGSTAALGATIAGNGNAGIRVGSLALFHDQGITFSGNGQDVACTHVTAISQPPGYCGH